MSEYRYYEFRTIDRPLDGEAQDELRRISSRARISPTRFQNEYQWGDLKADPLDILGRWFDVYLHLADGYSRVVGFRFPHASLDPAWVEPFCQGQTVALRRRGDHALLVFSVESEDEETPSATLSPSPAEDDPVGYLLPLRQDLLSGDARALYIGWLAGVEQGAVDDDALEPAVPPGLGAPSASLRQLARLLLVDRDLLAAAAAASSGPPPAPPEAASLAHWLAKVPTTRKDELLLALLVEPPLLVSGHLLQEYRSTAGRAGTDDGRPPAALRSAGQLREDAHRIRLERRAREEQEQAERRERDDRRKQEERQVYLQSLATREETLWNHVGALLSERKRAASTLAMKLLGDLHDLAALTGTGAQFQERLARVRATVKGRRAVLEQLDRLRP